MGLMKRLSETRISAGAYEKPKPPEPDPDNFRIERLVGIGRYTVALVHYPGCTTYQGYKVAVYDARPEVVKKWKKLDPHFHEDAHAPIARFPGSIAGWANAIAFATAVPNPVEEGR